MTQPLQANRKTLKLSFHGRVIDHLGIQMYQSPVAAIAELVSNAWDADAENVWIEVPTGPVATGEIVVKDDGLGMTFEECEQRYLNVGWSKREETSDKSSEKNRPVLGRKGIGKFAGFGIAEIMVIETVSKTTGEKTAFRLNVNSLRTKKYISENAVIEVDEYLGPDEKRKVDHGTTIRLRTLDMARRPSEGQFAKSMARRFLLPQRIADFKVWVNGSPLPQGADLEKVEFKFPQSYKAEEIPAGLTIAHDGWAEEKLTNGYQVRWQVVFYEDPIEEEELRGVSVFSHGKLAQAPFFFKLTGGLGGQHGQEYMSGQVEADFLDELKTDLIATDRQSVNWDRAESSPMQDWGQQRIKELLRIWRERRGEKRADELEQKVGKFGNRLDRLGFQERLTVKKALHKIAQIPTLNSTQFAQLGDAILTSWEQGRLKALISTIADLDSVTEPQLMNILLEAETLTALNIAEAVKTKILTVGGLKLRVQKHDLELAVRDFIAKNPWLISPKWETFRVEKSVNHIIRQIANEELLDGEESKGRIDLTLSSGEHLLVLEFMRPGKKVDWDHVQRFEKYVLRIRSAVAANTAGQFRRVTGYLIADAIDKDATLGDKIIKLERDDMFAMDWNTLFARALSQWQEFLGILVARAPEDERMQALREHV